MTKPIAIELRFHDRERNFIQGVPIIVDMPIPIPSVGEEVAFGDERWKVASRRFSYRLERPEDSQQFTDVQVDFVCDKVG